MAKSPSEHALVFTIDGTLYSESVVFKCFYWYGDRYRVTIERDPLGFQVSLAPREGSLSDSLRSYLVDKIQTDLIDFKTREIVVRETQAIRQILLAKAFASAGAFDSPPPGNASDPVGFEVDHDV